MCYISHPPATVQVPVMLLNVAKILIGTTTPLINALMLACVWPYLSSTDNRINMNLTPHQ